MEKEKTGQGSISLIGELTSGMKVSDAWDAGEKEPERKILYDGYRRKTREQDMHCTDRYRYRNLRKALKILFLLILIAVIILMLKDSLF